MKINRTRLLIFLTVLIISCAAEKRAADEIVFGVYCGECRINCSRMIRVTEHDSTVDTTQAFFEWLFDGRKKGDIYHNISKVRLAPETHQTIKGILNEIPSKMREYDQRIGCPDCADGCGIYLQISDKHWLIDPKEYDDKELSAFVDIVWCYDSIVRQEIFRDHYKLKPVIKAIKHVL